MINLILSLGSCLTSRSKYKTLSIALLYNFGSTPFTLTLTTYERMYTKVKRDTSPLPAIAEQRPATHKQNHDLGEYEIKVFAKQEYPQYYNTTTPPSHVV